MENPELANAAWWYWFWELIGTIAFFGVVLTLAIEFGAVRLAAPYKAILDNAREERISTANERAAKAELELAKFKAPRLLTQEQRGRIVDKLKQFSGTEFDIAISDSEPEILGLVFTIELVLSTAGWTELDWKGTGEALIRGGKQPLIRLGASVTNVWIGTHTGQPDKLFEFALALSNPSSTVRARRRGISY